MFVSYSRDDHEFVFPIVERLCAEGFRIWIDIDGIPVSDKDWPDTVGKKLRGSSRFLAFLSDNFQRSKECQKEVICYLEHHLMEEIEKSVIVYGRYRDLDKENIPVVMEYCFEKTNGSEMSSDLDDLEIDELIRIYIADPNISKCYDPRRKSLKLRLTEKRKEIIHNSYRNYSEEKQLTYTYDDTILEDLCKHRPTTKEEFIAISFLKEHKWEKFGRAVVEVIQGYLDDMKALKSCEAPADAEKPEQAAHTASEDPAPENTDNSAYKMPKPSRKKDSVLKEENQKIVEEFRKNPYIKGIAEKNKMSYWTVIFKLLNICGKSGYEDIAEELRKNDYIMEWVNKNRNKKDYKDLILRSGL